MTRRKAVFKFESNRIEVNRAIGKGALRGVQETTLDLLRRSVRQAPVDTGDLRGSASARINDREVAAVNVTRDSDGKMVSSNVQMTGGLPGVKRGAIEGVVGYNTPYAVRQHEDITFEHPRGGKAKYLEDPYTENRTRYQDHIRAAVAEEVE